MFVIAAIILVGGWLFDVQALRTLTLRSAAVVPNTALILAGASAALWLLHQWTSYSRRLAGAALCNAADDGRLAALSLFRLDRPLRRGLRTAEGFTLGAGFHAIAASLGQRIEGAAAGPRRCFRHLGVA